MTKFNWDDVFTTELARDVAAYRTETDPFRGPWRHRIGRKVMIELLYAEGVRWAGWYKPKGLQAKYDQVFGACLRGSFGPKRGHAKAR